MRTCAKCGGDIPSRMKIDGKVRVLKSRKYCLTCSPFGKHNTAKLHEPSEVDTTCTVCGRSYLYSRQRRKGATKTRCNACVVRARQRRLKRQGIELLGGKCLLCGYSRCQDALVFHHRDPEDKDFEVGHHWNRAWKVLKNEILKCALLCNRCHTEVHAGVSSLPASTRTA